MFLVGFSGFLRNLGKQEKLAFIFFVYSQTIILYKTGILFNKGSLKGSACRWKPKFKCETLFSTRLSTTFSNILSSIFKNNNNNNKKNGMLVSFWDTNDHTTDFTKDTLHSPF